MERALSDLRDLFARLATGPVFLVLGHGPVRAPTGERPGGWYFPSEFGSAPYDLVPEDAFERYQSSVAAAPIPDDLEAVLRLHWNGVFTTRIDSALSRWLEASWRRILPGANTQLGRHPRSTTELRLCYLFGGSSLPEAERPPNTKIQWLEARAHAAESLQTLGRTLVTPRGAVIVEDWSTEDWLTPQDLYTFATQLLPGQLHLFSASAETSSNEFVVAAVERGFLVLHNESFAAALQEAEDRGLLAVAPGERGEEVRLIAAGARFVSLGVDVWNKVLGSARPVDLSLLQPFPPSSTPLRYQRFHAFLGAAEGAPPWQAIASNFKLARTFESRLLESVVAALESPDDRGPIILMGQTATGKSVALAWLAAELARQGKAAVLHQSRRRDRPTVASLEEFSLWAEDVGLRTVLVWDGMTAPDDYFDLHRHLRARGQRVLVVGSSYLGADAPADAITAPIALDQAESASIASWLTTFGVDTSALASGSDTSFLALLYRTLPETEAGLRRGLALEMRSAESDISDLARTQPDPERRVSAIAQALFDAGFAIDTLTPSDRPEEELVNLAFSERSTSEQLSAMLLVAGSHGLGVPLELALRVVGREGFTTIVDFMKRFDIFRWTEEAEGGQFLGVRTRLEAQLLTRTDLTIATEAQVICDLVRHVRARQDRSGGDEVQFVVDLFQQVGPRATGERFTSWYGEFVDALRDQREAESVSHPRLALLESNLVREYVRQGQRGDVVAVADRISLIHSSLELLHRSIESGDAAPLLQRNLVVELAATYGTQLTELVNSSGPTTSQEIETLVERVEAAVMRARRADPENGYPVDVLAWSVRNAVNSGVLGRESKLSLLAEAKASLDSINADDLPPHRRAEHLKRQAEISDLLEDPELSTAYVAELMKLNNPSAYYILATRALGSSAPDSAATALRTLLDAPTEVREDWKCARLILDLYWQSKTGARLLRGEREPIPFSASDWRECLETIQSLHGTADFDQYRISFVRGLCLFHLGSVKASQEEFHRVGNLGSEITRRVVLSYTASDGQGEPLLFTGRVSWATPDGRRGKIWVDQLATDVEFVPLHFSSQDYRSKDEPMPTFHISFNYRGPLADPVRRFRQSSAR